MPLSRRNWAGAFWAVTAIPLVMVLDPSNPIWDESRWWEEQFGAPFAPLGPSGEITILCPILGGAWLRDGWAPRPGTSPKVSPIIRGTCGAQSSKLIFQKNLPWTPPLRKNRMATQFFYKQQGFKKLKIQEIRRLQNLKWINAVLLRIVRMVPFDSNFQYCTIYSLKFIF